MKYYLVTGAYGGMGKATTELLSQSGYTVFALDKKVEEPKKNVIPIEADITDTNSLKTAFNQIYATTQKLDAIIHFAGVYMLDSLVEIPDSEWDKIFKVNLYGAYNVNKYFLPLLNNGSRIIITTSELAPLDPLPFTGIYAITKSSLDKYAYSLRMELQLKDVQVSVIRAGAVSTGMLGASTTALDKFCEKTRLYQFSADKFRNIVLRVESKCVSPQKIAKKVVRVLRLKKTKFAYKINRNKLLLLLNFLPTRLQFYAIRKILKNSKSSNLTEGGVKG